MSEWAEAKFKECTRTEDTDYTLSGISLLQGERADMGKSVAYDLKSKKIPGSSLLFHGIVRVPEKTIPQTCFNAIAKAFGSDQTSILGRKEKEIKDSWETFEKEIEKKEIEQREMPNICWERLNSRTMFTLDEIVKFMETLVTKESSVDVPSSLSPDAASRPSPSGNTTASFLEGPILVTEEKLQIQKPRAAEETVASFLPAAHEETSKTDQEDGLELFWACIDRDGNIGSQYFFQPETQKEMIKFIRENPQSSAARFFIESGTLVTPILQKENLVLRNKVSSLENELDEMRKSLLVVTKDRDDRSREQMDSGGRKIAEMSLMKMEKEALETKIKGLEQNLETLRTIDKQKDKADEIVEMLKMMQISTEKIQDDVQVTKINSERAINILGSEREKRERFWTPAAEKLATNGAKIVVVAPESFFKVARAYRSLSRDMERMLQQKIISKIEVCGEGLDFANDFLKQRSLQGDWEKDSLVVVIIDGAEESVAAQLRKSVEGSDSISDAQKRCLQFVANTLGMAIEPESTKAVLLVGGPTLKEGNKLAKKGLLEKMGEQSKTTTLNMTEVGSENGKKDLEQWVHNGRWSALAVAHCLSILSWWADVGWKKEKDLAIPDRCSSCGFIHEASNCLKNEVPAANSKEAGEEMERNNNKQRSHPMCSNCGKGHSDPCRARYCRKCGYTHVGSCRPPGGPSSGREETSGKKGKWEER